MVLKPTGEGVTKATVRLKEHRNIRLDRIMKVGILIK